MHTDLMAAGARHQTDREWRMKTEIKSILKAVAAGEMSEEEALLHLKTAPYEDIGFAKVDLHRNIRQGVSEVVYGAGKTPEQIARILGVMKENGQERVLITRLSAEAYEEVLRLLGGTAGEAQSPADGAQEETPQTIRIKYYPEGRIAIAGGIPEPDGIGTVVVATGGTSDIPVAEEAALTAECFGNEVIRLYDVGVSGLHRLLSHMEEIMSASVIVAVAGMEGALASVIGGLADCPVIAVPTSVGYGASFEGLSALLSMLNCCSSGVSVVNIDNGFGAGYLAGMINHMEAKK